MNPLEQLALGAHALARALTEVCRVGPWLAFLPLVVAELLVLAALTWPVHPLFAPLAVPAVTGAAGERALHFPDGFRALPGLMARADLALGWALGALATAGAVHAFAARFRGAPVPARRSFAAGLKAWPAVALVMLPVQAVLAGIATVAAGAPARGLLGLVSGPAYVGAAIVVVAFALYLPVLVVADGRTPWGAVAALPRAWSRGLAATLVPALAVLLPLAGLDALLKGAPAIVDRGTPELVPLAQLLRLAVDVLGRFALAGAATLAFLSAVVNEEKEVA